MSGRSSTPAGPPLALLLRHAHERMASELQEELAAAGFADIRPAHGCVFENVDPGGTRLTELALRARLTKATLVYVIDDLERLGYVERIDDPSDRRAKRVRLTRRGADALITGRRTIDRIERVWAWRIGAEHVEALRRALERLDEDT